MLKHSWSLAASPAPIKKNMSYMRLIKARHFGHRGKKLGENGAVWHRMVHVASQSHGKTGEWNGLLEWPMVQIPREQQKNLSSVVQSRNPVQ